MKQIGTDYNKSYFEHLLKGILEVYYPHLADNKPFIVERSDEAYSLYIELINTDTKPSVTYELALSVLLDLP